MNEPLISVLVPVYKTKEYLARCVESIRNQTYGNLEIILVDDGSPDDSGTLCDQLALEDSRIRVVHKENGGLASARNAGIDAMNGEFAAFVDSDDYIAPEMIRSLYDLCVQHQAQVACCGIERVNDQGHVNYFNEKTGDFLLLDREGAMAELLENYRVTNSVCDKLIHKSVFDGLRLTEGYIYEDFDVMYRCLHRVDRVVYTGAAYYQYYMSQGSILRSTFNAKQFDLVLAARKRLAFFEKEYPQLMDVVRVKFLEMGLEIIYQSRNAPACAQMRQELEQELRQMLQAYPNLPMGKNMKLKVLFFKMGTAAFVLFFDAYLRLISRRA